MSEASVFYIIVRGTNLLVIALVGGTIAFIESLLIVHYSNNFDEILRYKNPSWLNTFGTYIVFTIFLYLPYWVFIKLFQNKIKLPILIVSLLTAFLGMISIYIPLNTFTIARPSITDSGMLKSLSSMFVAGLILPISEKYICKYFRKVFSFYE